MAASTIRDSVEQAACSGRRKEPGALRRVSRSGQLADSIFHYATLACALALLAVVFLVVTELVLQSRLSLGQFGWRFFSGRNWDPVAGDFGALPFIYGTVVSSALALALAMPLRATSSASGTTPRTSPKT